MNNLLSNLGLKAKLLFMMLSLCFLLVGFLLFLYSRAEQDLLEEVRRHTEELSTAIQISIEQISSQEGADLESFKSLMKVKKKGIREISVISNDRDVIASSNPRLIGKKLVVKGENARTVGNITEYTTTNEGQKNFDILLPVIMAGERLGYIHISTQFEDFAQISRTNNRNRLMATLAIFSIGIFAAFYLSKKYTDPIQSIVDAARKVAGGDLSVRLKVEGHDEIGRLTMNFNEMVKKLDENRELQSRLKEAEHMSKIGALASAIAHEVRNPLNLISLSVDHLRALHTRKQEIKEEEFASTVANIKSEIDRLDSLVSNFLNYGRPIKLKLKDLSLEPLIEETIAFLSDKCAVQKITVETRLSDTRSIVLADYRLMKTCMLNLFLNAIQAMPEGGTLRVETFLRDSSVTVSIADTGVGIETENLSRVFEPYFTTKDLGIGLGLALTKRVIEEHGGGITIESAVNSGTTVEISIPLRAET